MHMHFIYVRWDFRWESIPNPPKDIRAKFHENRSIITKVALRGHKPPGGGGGGKGGGVKIYSRNAYGLT